MEGLIFGILRYYVVNASPLALIKHNSLYSLVLQFKSQKEKDVKNELLVITNIFYYVTSHIIADHHLQKAKF